MTECRHKLIANYFQDRFEPDFSPLGHSNRCLEEAVIMCWIQYLQHVEGTLTAFKHFIKCIIIYCIAQGEHGSPSLRDIMIFLTSCDTIPPLGFTINPTIEFIDHDQLPVASTCSLTLTFSQKMNTNFATFKEIMDLAILGSVGFGCP